MLTLLQSVQQLCDDLSDHLMLGCVDQTFEGHALERSLLVFPS